MRDVVRLSLALSWAACFFGCHKKHISVQSIPEVAYPGCDGVPLPVGEVIARGDLRAGPTSLERDVVEHFTLRQRGCLLVGTTRQEWPRGIADVEIVWDDHSRPLRVWKRMSLPGVGGAPAVMDIRRYELRTPEVTIKRRAPDGHIALEILRGPRPTTVIAPGRGLLTAWIQRAHLQPGQSVREVAIDVRETVEVIRPVTLRRGEDLYQPWLHRTVRVYTVYGRESVFADDHDVVLGDLAGLRPSALVEAPAPAAMPSVGAADPEHTP